MKKMHIALKMNKKSKMILAAAAAVLAVTATGVTFALLNTKTIAADNEFSGAAVNIGVLEKNSTTGEYGDVIESALAGNEQFTRITEEDRTQTKVVAVRNVDRTDYPTADTYVRVRLVPSWVYDSGDQNGQTVPIDLKGKVTYTYSTGKDASKWKYTETAGELYYYYTDILAPGAVTPDLIESVSYTGDIPKNAHFELRVLAEGIAADQTDSLTGWGLNKSDISDSEGSTSVSSYFASLKSLTE